LVRYSLVKRLSVTLLAHLHQLSMEFHLNRSTGVVSRDIERGTRSVSALLSYLLFNIFPTFVELALVTSLLLIKYPAKFALITLITALLYVAFTFLVTEWRMQFRLAMNKEDSQANRRAIDSLLNYEIVKAFTNEQEEVSQYESKLDRWEKAAIRSHLTMSLLNLGQGSLISVGVLTIMIFAAQGVVDQQLTLGDLVLINTLMLQLFIPLGFLGTVYRELKNSLVDMSRLFDLLTKQPTVRDGTRNLPTDTSAATLRFEHVYFGYSADRTILHDINFELKAGTSLAIVGPSGSGKSTIARLIFRYYDVNRGNILVNDQPIQTLTLKSLRQAIGLVPQDSNLFNDTLYYNIAYANPAANEEDVRDAVTAAHLSPLVDQLPNGLQTLVGERGLKLSGGEKQRVAIARLLLKKSTIMVFDEATSSLDSATEKTIQQTLSEVSKNHTTLMIAHRLSTIVEADKILVLQAGKIIARGNHAELIKQGGLYAQMWQLQQETELNDTQPQLG
ncbi:MAG TPA: metal ABC transporter permease, partial [Gammaproteobacteria bacterium]|nr:metal ABC transporter permease [Gammaproteobacteria bacterium]